MKLVYQFKHFETRDAFIKIMEVVKDAGEILDSVQNIDETSHNGDDSDNIYIEYQGKIFKFNRYDKSFIAKVEEAQELNPYPSFHDGPWGHLHIKEIDDRFSNKKYYQIKKIKKNQEYVEILNDKIIEDLYNGCLLSN